MSEPRAVSNAVQVQALQGLRVLDLTRLLPGPYCTMLLADLGADVVKIEEPASGDPLRQADMAGLFDLVNRNKRSLTLDLKSPDGRGVFLKLAQNADVVVEGFRPGVMDRLGLGYAVLAAHNPRLIYASLSGFGASGPYRDRAGHDLNYLALAGVLGYNVDRQGEPLPPAVQVADLGAGTFAAVAILAGVIARQQTGRGQAVDVSLFASAMAWLPTLVAGLFAGGGAPAPGTPPLSGGLPHYGVYRTADGRYVTLGALEPRFFVNFLERIGRTDLALERDPAHLREALRQVFAGRMLAEWLECLADVDTCFAPVNTLDEALRDPQVQALGLVRTLGGRPQIAPPFAFSETPATLRRASPGLGQDTQAVLGELGLAEEEIATLRERRVI